MTSLVNQAVGAVEIKVNHRFAVAVQWAAVLLEVAVMLLISSLHLENDVSDVGVEVAG